MLACNALRGRNRFDDVRVKADGKTTSRDVVTFSLVSSTQQAVAVRKAQVQVQVPLPVSVPILCIALAYTVHGTK